MKILFVSGCPRSGTTFYSMNLFKNVEGFLVDRQLNYEPKLLHDAQHAYLFGHKNLEQFKSDFNDFKNKIIEQHGDGDSWCVIKQPYFSFILKELMEVGGEESRVLLTNRESKDILESRLNFKDSITQVLGDYSETWIHACNIDKYKNSWEHGSLQTKMEIYVLAQQEIEKDFHNHAKVSVVTYGHNPIDDKQFVSSLNLTQAQIEQIKNNFNTMWKNDEYAMKKKRDYEEATEFKNSLNFPQN
jgi:hypothetical protein